MRRHLLLTYFVLYVIIASAQPMVANSDPKEDDSSFQSFRSQLDAALRAKDLTALLPLLADTIFESEDGCGFPGCPRDTFLKYYFYQNNLADTSWTTFDEMLQVTEFGFWQIDDTGHETEIILHEPTVYQAPYFLHLFNPDKQVMIIGDSVSIYQKAGFKHEIVATLSNEVVDCKCGLEEAEEDTFIDMDDDLWIKIALPEGRSGYVPSKKTSYSIVKEISVAKVRGEWKIISYYHPPGC